MPHPIPDNVGDIEGWRYYLVPIPDDDTMVSVGWGIYSELMQYWNWGEEGVEADSEVAAQKWAEAVFEAIRLNNMSILEDIFGAIDEVEELLEALQTVGAMSGGCCDGITANGEPVETDLDPTGDPPATWGGDTVADASDWEQLVCGAAHAYVDYLKNMADDIDTIVQASLITVAAISGILGFLGGAGIILKVSYGKAAAAVAGLLGLANLTLFGDVADDLEAARQNIVCQVFEGSGATFAAAIEEAVGTLAWGAFFQFVDYSSARNVMLEGSHGSENLGVNRRTDCECGTISTITWTFDAGVDGWRLANTSDEDIGAASFASGQGNPPGSLLFDTGPRYRSPAFNLAAGDTVQLTIETSRQGGDGASRNSRWRLVDASLTEIVEIGLFGTTTEAWSSTTENGDVTGFAGGQVYLVANYTNTQQIFVDNVTLSIS